MNHVRLLACSYYDVEIIEKVDGKEVGVKTQTGTINEFLE